MPEQPLCRKDGEDLLLQVKVSTRRSTEQVLLRDGRLNVQLKAAPVDGKANMALCRLLAKAFGVPASRVSVERGETARNKLIRIHKPSRQPDWMALLLTQ